MRGNQHFGGQTSAPSGSIPARAGEPNPTSIFFTLLAVYPRACGGTVATSVQSLTMPGLSPRVRGNPDSTGSFIAPRGSIPARAGEPYKCVLSIGHFRVYPRACGGTSILAHFALVNQGLSPSALLHGQAGVGRGVRR